MDDNEFFPQGHIMAKKKHAPNNTDVKWKDNLSAGDDLRMQEEAIEKGQSCQVILEKLHIVSTIQNSIEASIVKLKPKTIESTSRKRRVSTIKSSNKKLKPNDEVQDASTSKVEVSKSIAAAEEYAKPAGSNKKAKPNDELQIATTTEVEAEPKPITDAVECIKTTPSKNKKAKPNDELQVASKTEVEAEPKPITDAAECIKTTPSKNKKAKPNDELQVASKTEVEAEPKPITDAAECIKTTPSKNKKAKPNDELQVATTSKSDLEQKPILDIAESVKIAALSKLRSNMQEKCVLNHVKRKKSSFVRKRTKIKDIASNNSKHEKGDSSNLMLKGDPVEILKQLQDSGLWEVLMKINQQTETTHKNVSESESISQEEGRKKAEKNVGSKSESSSNEGMFSSPERSVHKAAKLLPVVVVQKWDQEHQSPEKSNDESSEKLTEQKSAVLSPCINKAEEQKCVCSLQNPEEKANDGPSEKPAKQKSGLRSPCLNRGLLQSCGKSIENSDVFLEEPIQEESALVSQINGCGFLSSVSEEHTSETFYTSLNHNKVSMPSQKEAKCVLSSKTGRFSENPCAFVDEPLQGHLQQDSVLPEKSEKCLNNKVNGVSKKYLSKLGQCRKMPNGPANRMEQSICVSAKCVQNNKQSKNRNLNKASRISVKKRGQQRRKRMEEQPICVTPQLNRTESGTLVEDKSSNENSTGKAESRMLFPSEISAERKAGSRISRRLSSDRTSSGSSLLSETSNDEKEEISVKSYRRFQGKQINRMEQQSPTINKIEGGTLVEEEANCDEKNIDSVVASPSENKVERKAGSRISRRLSSDGTSSRSSLPSETSADEREAVSMKSGRSRFQGKRILSTSSSSDASRRHLSTSSSSSEEEGKTNESCVEGSSVSPEEKTGVINCVDQQTFINSDPSLQNTAEKSMEAEKQTRCSSDKQPSKNVSAYPSVDNSKTNNLKTRCSDSDSGTLDMKPLSRSLNSENARSECSPFIKNGITRLHSDTPVPVRDESVSSGYSRLGINRIVRLHRKTPEKALVCDDSARSQHSSLVENVNLKHSLSFENEKSGHSPLVNSNSTPSPSDENVRPGHSPLDAKVRQGCSASVSPRIRTPEKLVVNLASHSHSSGSSISHEVKPQSPGSVQQPKFTLNTVSQSGSFAGKLKRPQASSPEKVRMNVISDSVERHQMSAENVMSRRRFEESSPEKQSMRVTLESSSRTNEPHTGTPPDSAKVPAEDEENCLFKRPFPVGSKPAEEATSQQRRTWQNERASATSDDEDDDVLSIYAESELVDEIDSRAYRIEQEDDAPNCMSRDEIDSCAYRIEQEDDAPNCMSRDEIDSRANRIEQEDDVTHCMSRDEIDSRANRIEQEDDVTHCMSPLNNVEDDDRRQELPLINQETAVRSHQAFCTEQNLSHLNKGAEVEQQEVAVGSNVFVMEYGHNSISPGNVIQQSMNNFFKGYCYKFLSQGCTKKLLCYFTHSFPFIELEWESEMLINVLKHARFRYFTNFIDHICERLLWKAQKENQWRTCFGFLLNLQFTLTEIARFMEVPIQRCDTNSMQDLLDSCASVAHIHPPFIHIFIHFWNLFKPHLIRSINVKPKVMHKLLSYCIQHDVDDFYMMFYRTMRGLSPAFLQNIPPKLLMQFFGKVEGGDAGEIGWEMSHADGPSGRFPLVTAVGAPAQKKDFIHQGAVSTEAVDNEVSELSNPSSWAPITQKCLPNHSALSMSVASCKTSGPSQPEIPSDAGWVWLPGHEPTATVAGTNKPEVAFGRAPTQKWLPGHEPTSRIAGTTKPDTPATQKCLPSHSTLSSSKTNRLLQPDLPSNTAPATRVFLPGHEPTSRIAGTTKPDTPATQKCLPSHSALSSSKTNSLLQPDLPSNTAPATRVWLPGHEQTSRIAGTTKPDGACRVPAQKCVPQLDTIPKKGMEPIKLKRTQYLKPLTQLKTKDSAVLPGFQNSEKFEMRKWQNSTASSCAELAHTSVEADDKAKLQRSIEDGHYEITLDILEKWAGKALNNTAAHQVFIELQNIFLKTHIGFFQLLKISDFKVNPLKKKIMANFGMNRMLECMEKDEWSHAMDIYKWLRENDICIEKTEVTDSLKSPCTKILSCAEVCIRDGKLTQAIRLLKSRNLFALDEKHWKVEGSAEDKKVLHIMWFHILDLMLKRDIEKAFDLLMEIRKHQKQVDPDLIKWGVVILQELLRGKRYEMAVTLYTSTEENLYSFLDVATIRMLLVALVQQNKERAAKSLFYRATMMGNYPHIKTEGNMKCARVLSYMTTEEMVLAVKHLLHEIYSEAKSTPNMLNKYEAKIFIQMKQLQNDEHHFLYLQATVNTQSQAWGRLLKALKSLTPPIDFDESSDDCITLNLKSVQEYLLHIRKLTLGSASH